MIRLLRWSVLVFVLLGFGSIGAAFGKDQVLVGTEVVERSSFPIQQVSETIEGTYLSEQGGAVVTGKLTNSGTDWQFVRAFAEPGSEPITAAYSLVKADNGLSGEGDDIQILPVKDGILVLELATDDLLPSDLWIFYQRQN